MAFVFHVGGVTYQEIGFWAWWYFFAGNTLHTTIPPLTGGGYLLVCVFVVTRVTYQEFGELLAGNFLAGNFQGQNASVFGVVFGVVSGGEKGVQGRPPQVHFFSQERLCRWGVE